MHGLKCLLTSLAAALGVVQAQVANSWPHNYTGKPSGDFSPEWQPYFEVDQTLPNVTFPIQRNWAGSISVDRSGHPNNTLFFWAWEKQDGSFTADSEEPWGIWLNGGPGSSSMLGLFFENCPPDYFAQNGPLHIASDHSLSSNNFSWNNIADYVWVDQPVGTGFSTADATGFVDDEDQTGADFMNFLSNLVKVFPNLKTRPLHITGESYAGIYIPYITKAYFGLEDPPVNLASIAIGDGSIGSKIVNQDLPVLSVIETYPQLIGYDPQVYEYFKEQHHLCGYDINLTYPQTGGHFPTVDPPFPGKGDNFVATHKSHKARLFKHLLKQDTLDKRDGIDRRDTVIEEQRAEQREMWKRDLTGRANGTIDPWYRCDLYDEIIDYALNFSLPWKGSEFDQSNIPDALDPEAPMDASVFLNDPDVRAAIHAPASKSWTNSINYPFGSKNSQNDPSVEPMAFLTELATNATERGVHVVIYSGNDDSLVAHASSETVIQNTTFGGIQGFSRPPSTPWFGDDGEFAGVVHQERNWTYVLVKGAGHLVPQQQPERAFVLAREFIYGNNQTGLVTDSSGTFSVVGGENSTLANAVLPGQDGIFVGSGTTQSTYTYPSATIAAWESFIATVTTESFSALPTGSATAQSGTSAAGRVGVSVWGALAVIFSVGLAIL